MGILGTVFVIAVIVAVIVILLVIKYGEEDNQKERLKIMELAMEAEDSEPIPLHEFDKDQLILGEALSKMDIAWDAGWCEYTVKFMGRVDEAGNLTIYGLSIVGSKEV